METEICYVCYILPNPHNTKSSKLESRKFSEQIPNHLSKEDEDTACCPPVHLGNHFFFRINFQLLTQTTVALVKLSCNWEF